MRAKFCQDLASATMLAIIVIGCVVVLLALTTIGWRARNQRRMRALRWPDGLSLKRFTRFSVAYLRCQGWQIRNERSGSIAARKGKFWVEVHCRCDGSLVGKGFLSDIQERQILRGVKQIILTSDPVPGDIALEAVQRSLSILLVRDFAKVDEIVTTAALKPPVARKTDG